MDRNFAKSLKLVLKYEGGYVNHPDDPGGPTNKGVTLATFRRYVKKGGTVADLQAITDAQVATVYRKQYWNAVDGDGLPSGVDFAVFDYAVNSGPGRAKKVSGGSIDEICNKRLAFMKSLKTWKTFGKGWAARVADVRKNAHVMAASTRPAPVATIPPIEPKPAPAPVPVTDKELIRRVQTGLTLLNYNPGGADGVIGPLTAGAIRIFRADNSLPPGDFIDEALINTLANAKVRQMVPERANATVSQVAAVVPEAKVHWWTRLSAGVLGGSVGGVGLLDQITPAVGYLTPVKEFIGDVPPGVWIGGIVVVCAALYFGSQYGANKAKEAYRAGDRR